MSRPLRDIEDRVIELVDQGVEIRAAMDQAHEELMSELADRADDEHEHGGEA